MSTRRPSWSQPSLTTSPGRRRRAGRSHGTSRYGRRAALQRLNSTNDHHFGAQRPSSDRRELLCRRRRDQALLRQRRRRPPVLLGLRMLGAEERTIDRTTCRRRPEVGWRRSPKNVFLSPGFMSSTWIGASAERGPELGWRAIEHRVASRSASGSPCLGLISSLRGVGGVLRVHHVVAADRDQHQVGLVVVGRSASCRRTGRCRRMW